MNQSRFPLRGAAVLVACVLLAGCGGGGGATPGTSIAAAPPTNAPSIAAASSPTVAPSVVPTLEVTPSPAPSPTASPASADFPLTAEVWFGGYLIDVTGGSYNATKHALTIDATFKNTSGILTQLVHVGSSTTVVWNGQTLIGYVTAADVPVGATVKSQIQVQTPPAFVVADAVLTFGTPAQHQATVPLGGAAAASDQPVPLAIVGTLKLGRYVTYKVTSAMLVPATCSGYPERIGFGPQPANLVSIVVWGTVASSDAVNQAHLDQSYLVLADKSKVIGVPAMGLEIANGATIPNVAVCFAVAEPGSGTYLLKLHEYRSNVTGSLQFLIP
jgi:hypothetical protein